MHQRAKTTLTALAIAATVVVTMDAYTYAGTGDSLLLGKSNKAGRTTSITNNGPGPALSLHAKGNRAPLAVDSTAKVARLNADIVDGKGASALQNNVRVYTAKPATHSVNGALRFDLPRLPSGHYLATYSAYLEAATGSPSQPTTGQCHLNSNGAERSAGWTASVSASHHNVALSGSGVFVSKANQPWFLYCFAEQQGVGRRDWLVSRDNPVQITVTRIDRRLGGTLAAVG